jgi:glucuronate isomerase
MPLTLNPDRLFPVDPHAREVARGLYETTRNRPILSPHGHVDPRLLADDQPFPDPAQLLITPDHYVTRLLHAHGVPLEQLGLPNRTTGEPAADSRTVWRTFCSLWHVFRATPSRLWLEAELVDVFGLDLQPCADTADRLYDALAERLASPEYRPRALFDRFGIEVLATTDDPADDLAAHDQLAADPAFTGRVVPTFRPDRFVDPSRPDFAAAVGQLADAVGSDVADYSTFLAALEDRRSYFADHGATATDHGHTSADSMPLSPGDAERIFSAGLDGTCTPAEAAAFRGNMLFESIRMAAEDGLTMQLHPGVMRNYDPAAFAAFGADTGHDIPTTAEYTHALHPALAEYGNAERLHLVLFTIDETVFSRELAPLAGYYPSVYVGAPWWFIDTPDAILRYRSAVTDSAGFYKTSGFIDDTRAFCSIPARHDMSRRLDAAFLARLVGEGRLDPDEAAEVAVDLVDAIPRKVFRL